ncbi:hypothetical protein PRIPAC_96368, partial [Pristionchus pacificus]|uniref:Ribosomal protein n=1 Tax=Pristionchus pacificus TaxID=54126 RepID=A0A2A6CTY5_PRIPA
QLGDEWAVNEAVDFAPTFELESDLPEVKLFGKWNLQEVNVADISLVDYITVKEKYGEVFNLLCVYEENKPSLAMWLLGTGAHEAAFRNIKTIAECLADELINAAKESPNYYAIEKKDEPERVAQFNV